MARRAGGSRGGQRVSGIRAGFIRRQARYDKAFHHWWRADDPLPEGGCPWCNHIADAQSGRPLVLTAKGIWHALFDDRDPRAAEAWRDREGLFEVDAEDRVRQIDSSSRGV